MTPLPPKRLGTIAPDATTEADLYICPENISSVISSFTVCNRGANATFRLSHSTAGEVTANSEYLYYDLAISAGDTFIATIGVTMSTSDCIRVYASTADLSFNIYGQEIQQ